MDDQFRNRFRRYDDNAPLRHRPHASPPAVSRPPASAPTSLTPDPPPSQPPRPQPPKPLAASRQREPIPPRPEFTQPNPKRASKPKTKSRRKRKGIRRLLAIALFMLIAAAALFLLVIKPRSSHQSSTAPASSSNGATTAPKTAGKMIQLVAVGDSIAYSSINQAAQSGGSYDYAPLMKSIKPLFSKADVRICSQSVPAGAAAGTVSGPPTFNAPPQFAKGLEDTGCNVIDLASPNMNDKGQAAIDASVGNFDQQGGILAIAGANRSLDEQKKIRYFTVSGLKFAYLAYTTTSNVANPTPFGVNIYSDSLADAQIKEARQNAALVIVSMHWGTDQAADQNSTQDTIAQHLAADNVDIVIGNGPHVIQPVKVLSGSTGHQTLVWFSLGNFLTSQVPVETVMGGMAVMDIDSTTQQLHNPRLLPLYMHYEWTAAQKQHQSDADLLARKNFQLVPLDQAAGLLAQSQNGTTVQAQQQRIKAIVNKYFQVPLISSTDL